LYAYIVHRYLSRTKYESLQLVQNPSFNWLIDYDVDTTVSQTQCAYDRYDPVLQYMCTAQRLY